MYTHHKVNHSDLATGCHTYAIEDFWRSWRIYKIIVFCFMLINRKRPLSEIMQETIINWWTGVYWNNFQQKNFRHIYRKETLLRALEMDESNIDKQKCHRGHAVEGQWVHGGIKRGTNKCFLLPIKTVRSESLFQAFFCLSLKRIEDLSLWLFPALGR